MTPHKRTGGANEKNAVRNNEPSADMNKNDLLLALDQLYQLLEEHAPSWYTQKHHESAEAALRSSKKH